MKKVLCSEDSCFKYVEPEWEHVLMADGSVHPVSTKCWDCRTDEDRRRLKNYQKHRRQAANKLRRKNEGRDQ